MQSSVIAKPKKKIKIKTKKDHSLSRAPPPFLNIAAPANIEEEMKYTLVTDQVTETNEALMLNEKSESPRSILPDRASGPASRKGTFDFNKILSPNSPDVLIPDMDN